MGYTYTLADHIYQDRVLFKIPKRLFHVENPDSYTEHYYYDEDKTARVEFYCTYHFFHTGYNTEFYTRGLTFSKHPIGGGEGAGICYTYGGSTFDNNPYGELLTIDTRVNEEKEELEFYINDSLAMSCSKEDIYKNFSVNFTPVKDPRVPYSNEDLLIMHMDKQAQLYFKDKKIL